MENITNGTSKFTKIYNLIISLKELCSSVQRLIKSTQNMK